VTDPTWLPEALQPAVVRLGRVDDLIYEMGDLAGSWSQAALTLRQSRRGEGRFRASVESVRPVPPIAALLFSEAVNHLRAVLDNAVWHLVVTHSEPLGEQAARKVALPIYRDSTSFAAWAEQVRVGMHRLDVASGEVPEHEPVCRQRSHSNTL